jgi:hypothetical protein
MSSSHVYLVPLQSGVLANAFPSAANRWDSRSYPLPRALMIALATFHNLSV